MKLSFEKIEEALDNPIFELRCLGKEAIKQRILPPGDFSDMPELFHFTEWTEDDSSQVIEYAFHTTEIGELLIASTRKGICFLGFAHQGKSFVLDDFQRRFSGHPFREQTNDFQKQAAGYCNGIRGQTMCFQLQGTEFQLNIWKKLLCIPRGKVSTYGALLPGFKGTQAIGRAVGSNPVSSIFPCHRIVRRDGNYEGYHWGNGLKRLLLAYEFQESVPADFLNVSESV